MRKIRDARELKSLERKIAGWEEGRFTPAQLALSGSEKTLNYRERSEATD
jgi:hypothetical protein